MSIRMIVVDDEQLSLESMEEYLRQLYPNAEVRCFDQPLNALTSLREQDADVALLDIKMPGSINGIALAMQMKRIVPEIKLLFCTGYSEYALEAFKIHANGYLCKPIMKEDLKNELAHVLGEKHLHTNGKPFVHTFGNFDVFANGEPVLFRRIKSKEVLAWLTDRKGAWVTNKELIANLWEEYDLDTAPAKYASLIVKSMISDLERYGIAHIVEHRRGQIRLCTEQVACDYYAMLSGNVDALNYFRGEYMAQYSWGEITLANLLRTVDL